MTWLSLGLDLETARLPTELERQLQERWQTVSLVDTPLKVMCFPGELPPQPDVPAQQITVSNTVLDIWAQGDELWLGNHLHLQLAAAPRLTVHLAAPSEAAWLLALAELQRLSGWLPLHAATVARESRAVGITGVSGAGKSTAALRLAAAGLSVLAEDQTWVHAGSGRVLGLDRFLRTYPDSLDRFAPELRAAAQGQDAYGKLMVPLTPPTMPATLDTLLVFGLPQHPSRAEGVRALWECTGVPLLTRTRQASAQAVNELLRRLTVQGTTREKVIEQTEEMLLKKQAG